MKTALLKNEVKEIKYSYKRFLSILLIVLLGVGFFAGLRAASPDMKKTIDVYFDELNVMDLQVISTLGLTDEDITAINNVEGVEKAEGSYQTDAIVKIGDEESVVKLETFSEEINKLELLEGRMPENIDECVVESSFLINTNHNIGDKIKVDVEKIKNDDGEEQDVLKNNELKIVGTVKSPIYISTERGSTELGSGVIDYYMYIPKENINVDIYTNIYLSVEGARDLNTTDDKYEEKVDNIKDKLEEISEERRQARYDQLYDSANTKIKDAEKELNKEKEKAEKELEDAKKELDDGKEKIKTGKAEIEKNEREAASQFASAEKELEDAEKEIEKNENEYKETKKQVENQIKEYEAQLETLETTKTELDSAKEELTNAKELLEDLEEKIENITDENEKEELKKQIEETNVKIQTLQATVNIINDSLKENGITNLNSTINKLKEGIKTARNGLTSAEEKIQEAKKQVTEGKRELQNSKDYTYAMIEEAKEELKDAEQEITDGEKELEKAEKEFDEKIKDAEDKLLDAKEELKKIERPEWYVLDRNQNVGYASYVQDTDRVASLAQVFPVVFFLVAALISLTSMSRMVEEERVEIGTLKALGYSKRQISRKYLIYAILATIIGGIIGLFIGFNFLPKIVANMYGMVYAVPEVILEFNTEIALIGMLSAILCTVGATLYTCIRELIHNPATLMRPKAPKPGKRVILEKIPLIWKHLNFTAKVTARNLFRYKKRFLMTIIGVCGCTALIVAGFGLRDAISSMIPKQFGEIDKYNLSITLKNEKYQDELEKLKDKITKNDQITNTLGVNVQSVKILKNDNNQSIQLIVPEDVNKLEEFISLRDRKNKEDKYILDSSGIIISEKLANLLEIKEGDIITLENADGDRADVKVSKITENYIMHYIYISPELYNDIYDTRIESNMIYCKTEEMNETQEDELGKILLDNNEISGVSFTSASEDMFKTVMDNMDMVVWILIIAAGLLALVVLYNLLNANISERIRELATIKVLGFYDREVYSYIARETIILTIIGIIFGLVGGYFLTMYILKTCELDITMFSPEVKFLSYILGIIITVFFAIIVNIVTYFSLKKIDMIESLKSVE